MKYSKVGFRQVYKKFCLFDLTDTIRKAMRDFPGVDEANAVLTYGYIDHEAGLTVEILCACKKDGKDDIRLADGNDEVRSFIRIGAVKDVKFMHIDPRIGRRFMKKLETLRHYEPELNEGLHEDDDIDHLRHEYNIDDVMVILRKKGAEKGEGVWVRLEGTTELFIIGKLLNEPYEDYGYHEGDMVCIRKKVIDGKTTLFLDERSPENDYEFICDEDFEDLSEEESEQLIGEQIFEKAVKVYLEDPNEKNFAQLFAFMSIDRLWVPMSAHFSGPDEAKIMKMIEESDGDIESLKGTEFTADEEVHLKPDILENSGKFFFPVFTAEWVIVDEYAKNFSIIPMRLKQVLEYILMYKEKELSGMVINAFTSPVEFPMEVVRSMLGILIKMMEDGINE